MEGVVITHPDFPRRKFGSVQELQEELDNKNLLDALAAALRVDTAFVDQNAVNRLVAKVAPGLLHLVDAGMLNVETDEKLGEYTQTTLTSATPFSGSKPRGPKPKKEESATK